MIQVEETWLGSSPSVVIVETFGGTVGSYTVVAHGFPSFQEGERLVVFLDERQDGTTEVVGYRLGQYRVVAKRLGQDIPVPTLENGGTLLTPDGRGVANARIYAWRPVSGGRPVGAALFAYRTDASGQWVLAFPDDFPRSEVRVRVRAPGQPTVWVRTEILPGRTNSLRQTSFTGAVLYQSGVPVEGGRVQVEGFPGRGVTDADGRWSYIFPLDTSEMPVAVRVTHPPGAQPPERVVNVAPRSTVHVPVFEAPNPPAPIPTIKENRHA